MVDSTGPQCLWCRTSETSYHDKDDRQCKYYCLFNEFSHDSNDVCCNGSLLVQITSEEIWLYKFQIHSSVLPSILCAVLSFLFYLFFTVTPLVCCLLWTLYFVHWGTCLYCVLGAETLGKGEDTHSTGHPGTCLLQLCVVSRCWVYLVMGLDGFLSIAPPDTSSGCPHT